MFGLGNTGGIVTVVSLVAIAALWEFLVMTGMHQVLLTLGIVQLLTLGSDSCVMVAGGIAQFATWGMAFGLSLIHISHVCALESDDMGQTKWPPRVSEDGHFSR